MQSNKKTFVKHYSEELSAFESYITPLLKSIILAQKADELEEELGIKDMSILEGIEHANFKFKYHSGRGLEVYFDLLAVNEMPALDYLDACEITLNITHAADSIFEELNADQSVEDIVFNIYFNQFTLDQAVQKAMEEVLLDVDPCLAKEWIFQARGIEYLRLDTCTLKQFIAEGYQGMKDGKDNRAGLKLLDRLKDILATQDLATEQLPLSLFVEEEYPACSLANRFLKKLLGIENVENTVGEEPLTRVGDCGTPSFFFEYDAVSFDDGQIATIAKAVLSSQYFTDFEHIERYMGVLPADAYKEHRMLQRVYEVFPATDSLTICQRGLSNILRKYDF